MTTGLGLDSFEIVRRAFSGFHLKPPALVPLKPLALLPWEQSLHSSQFSQTKKGLAIIESSRSRVQVEARTMSAELSGGQIFCSSHLHSTLVMSLFLELQVILQLLNVFDVVGRWRHNFD